MPIVQNRDGEFIFTEKIPNGLRVVLSIIGLFPMFLAPYELLIRPNWNGFSLYLVIPFIISIGAIFVGGAFVVAGVFGLNQTLIVSAKSKTIQYFYDSAVIPLRKKIYKFGDIAKVVVTTHDWTDGPSTYGLSIIFSNGEKISIGSFGKTNEAELCKNKIEQLIQ